jgi:voltage-gated potassium channel
MCCGESGSNARGLISAVGSDENVHRSARLTRADLFIIGRAENGDAIKLRPPARPRVLALPGRAHQMAQAALRPAVVDFVQLATSSEQLELGIEQIRLTAASRLCGQSLAAANVRQRFRGGGRRDPAGRRQDKFNPPPGRRCRRGPSDRDGPAGHVEAARRRRRRAPA